MRKLLFQSLFSRPLTEAAPAANDAALAEVAAALGRVARRRLGRSLSIREIDAGSCNGCELEIHALNNAYYDVERFGLRFVASPRHADVLMVTGPVTRNMREALERTYHATPNPKWVVAIGDCARDGGCFAGSYAVVGGVSEVIPVDLHIPGCPPTPTEMLKGLLALMERADRRCALRILPAADAQRARSRAREDGLFGWTVHLRLRDMLAKPNAAASGCAGHSRIDQLDPGIVECGNELHEGIDIAADDTVAGFHALDGRHRQVRQFGHLPLIDVQERTRGPELIGGDHGSHYLSISAEYSYPLRIAVSSINLQV